MSSAHYQFENYIGKLIRVLLSDNRVIEGELSCMDKDLNFILNNSIEYHGLRDDEVVDLLLSPEKVVSRRIGMAMVPGYHVIKILCRMD